MENDLYRLYQIREEAKAIFFAQRSIYNPYFGINIVLNSKGFHHLRYSNRKERSIKEQLYKLKFLHLGLEIIKKAGTVQEYRKVLIPIDTESASGASLTRYLEFWGFIGIVGEKNIKVRVIVRRKGDGPIIFWSVMLYSKMKNGEQKLSDDNNIED